MRMFPVAGPVYTDIFNARFQVFKYVVAAAIFVTVILMPLMFAFPVFTATDGFLVSFLGWIGVSAVAMLWSGLRWALGGRLIVADLRLRGVSLSGLPSVRSGAYLSLWLKKHGVTPEQLHEAGAARELRVVTPPGGQ